MSRSEGLSTREEAEEDNSVKGRSRLSAQQLRDILGKLLEEEVELSFVLVVTADDSRPCLILSRANSSVHTVSEDIDSFSPLN